MVAIAAAAAVALLRTTRAPPTPGAALLRPLAHRSDPRFARRLLVSARSGGIVGVGPGHGRIVVAVEEALAGALRADPADVGAYLDAHERFLWLGDWPRAERGATTILAGSPQSGPALALLSAVRFEQGRREEGAALSERALLSEPDLVLGRVGRAKALHARGDIDAAAAELVRAIAVGPARPEAHFALGAFLADRNRYAEAVPHLEAVLEHEPDPGMGKAGYVGRSSPSRGPSATALPIGSRGSSAESRSRSGRAFRCPPCARGSAGSWRAGW